MRGIPRAEARGHRTGRDAKERGASLPPPMGMGHGTRGDAKGRGASPPRPPLRGCARLCAAHLGRGLGTQHPEGCVGQSPRIFTKKRGCALDKRGYAAYNTREVQVHFPVTKKRDYGLKIPNFFDYCIK